jgi:S-adenosylmethionine decarboxylase
LEAKIDNFSSWVPYSDNEQLKEDVVSLITQSGFTILNFMEHHFEPQGYTAIWLLAESHCALHTFPEENKAYVEISSCNSDMYVNFVVAFNQYLKDGKV